jgi:hypothetical protein
MEKRDEKLRGLEAELAEMEADDAVVTTVDLADEKPGKYCDQKR